MWESPRQQLAALVGSVSLLALGAVWVSGGHSAGDAPAAAHAEITPEREARPTPITTAHVQAVYAAHRDLVFERPVDIAASDVGLVMRNRVPEMEDVSPTAPELVDRFHVTMPERGADAIEMHVTPDVTLRVFEDDMTGDAQQVDGAVSYARSGGRVYWTGFENGFEEWLAIEEGLAHAAQAVATWRVENATLRELGEGVMVTDAHGEDRLYVTAPHAWNRAGEEVAASLRVEDQRIALHVDADGAEVLVDPLWRPTGAMVVPRREHHLVSIPNGALALGGLSPMTIALFSAETYDSLSRTWSMTANNMAFPRRDAVVIPYRHNGVDLVLVAGGANGAILTTNSEIYDVDTRTFFAVDDPMNVARKNAAGVQLTDGRILVTGGGDTGQGFTSTELFNPVTREWTPSGNLIYGRREHQMVNLDFYSEVLVIGGYSPLDNSRASIERYDLVNGTWTEGALMNDQRAEFSVLNLGNSSMLVTGGINTQSNSTLATAELYDPAGPGTWDAIPNMSEPRVRHNTVEYYGDSTEGVAWVIGANTTQFLSFNSMGVPYWTTGPSMNANRTLRGVALVGLEVLAAGGNGSAAGTSEVLTPGCMYDNGGCSAQSSCTDAATTITCGPCNAGYISTDGTGNFTCTACPTATAYQPMAGQTSCLTKATCQPGTRVQSNGTITTNRTCTACTAGTNFSTTTNAASCTPVSSCVAGQRVNTPPSTSSDRVCEPCPSGTFSTSPNAAICALHSNCGFGTFVSTVPTAAVDRGCSACPSETFSNSNNVMACTPATQCGAGTRVLAQLTPASNRTCTACGAGTFSLGMNTLTCTAHSTCMAGEYVTTTPTALVDRGCSACPGETFSATSNASTCTAATTCGAGTFVASALTPSSDRTCSLCGAGTYSSGNNAVTCTAHTDCQPGTFEASAPTSTADRSCSSCASGMFSSSVNATGCAPVTDCQPGEYETSAPTSSVDRTCAPCDAGTFSTGGNATSCTACTVCDAGFIETAACSATSDTECTPSTDAGVPVDAGSGVDMGSGTPDGGGADAGDDAGDDAGNDAGNTPDAAGSDGGRVDAGGMPPSSGGGCTVSTDSRSNPGVALAMVFLLTGLGRTVRRRRR
jgi:hypothetical protein